MSENLKKLTKNDLLKLATRRKVKASSSMKKDEIISLLEKGSSKKTAKKKAAARKPAAKKAKSAAKKAGAVKKNTEKKKAVAKKATTAKPSLKKAKAVNAKTQAASKARRPKQPSAQKPAIRETSREKAAPSAPPPSGKDNWVIDFEEKKFFVAEELEDFPGAEEGEFTEKYGDNRIVALARDPRKLYVYWEANGSAAESARKALGGKGWERLSWILRVYDVTGVESFDVASAQSSFDTDASPVSGAKYIEVDLPDHEYIVALGLVDDEGGFAPVALSNRARTPRDKAAEEAGLEWKVPDELFAQLYGLSGGGLAGASSLGMGASEQMAQIGEISSGAVSSFGASEEMVRKAKERGFFFWLNCELIVYGGTAPDAKVTMMGREIALRPDGTFSARFALPDGIHDIPVTAESADKVEKREISPTVSRATRVSEEKLEEAEPSEARSEIFAG